MMILENVRPEFTAAIEAINKAEREAEEKS